MILQGDCLGILKELEACSIDAVVTDPPAGISFMGKDWDGDKGGRIEWIAWFCAIMRECLRVLKPGAHGLVWAIPRTSHWTATALEDAGFEIRDIVTHIFGSGFPKSMDISKAIDKAAGQTRRTEYKPNFQNNDYGKGMGGGEWNAPSEPPKTPEAKTWQGFGTALKPASEHWILVRKPLEEKTVAANVLKHGTGGINIDASRIEFQSESDKASSVPGGRVSYTGETFGQQAGLQKDLQPKREPPSGRFPANLVLSGDAIDEIDKQAGDNVSRFFYCAKASKADKNNGLDLSVSKAVGNRPNSADMTGKFPDHDQRERVGNFHPTVKSTKLMSYLIKLITPPNGVVLDPFTGSGSTGVAALRHGFKFIGIEQDQEYTQIAEKRISHALPVQEGI